jgi:hypothetical protein
MSFHVTSVCLFFSAGCGILTKRKHENGKKKGLAMRAKVEKEWEMW